MASISGASSSNTVSSLMNSANMISGLASGLDTEGMIEQLVQSYQTKINQLSQKITKTEWKQDAYRSIITKMVGFSSKYTSYTSATNLASSSFFNNAVTVNALGKYAEKVAASGKTSSDVALNAVHQLATSAQFRTSGNLKSGDGQSIVADNGIDLVNGTTELFKLDGSLTLTYGTKNISIQFDEVADVKALAEIKEKNAGISEDEALGKLIEQKLANEQISLTGGVTYTADKRIKVEVKDGAISFSDKSTAGNDVYISQADKKLASTLGLNLTNASETKPSTIRMSDDMQKRLTKDEKNSVYFSGKTMNLSLDGTTKQITLPTIYNGQMLDSEGNITDLTPDNYADAINAAVQKAFKGNKIEVTNADETGKTLQLSFAVKNQGSSLVINTDIGEGLKIGQSATSYLNTSKTLGDLMGDKLGKGMEPAYERDENGKYKLDANGDKILRKDEKGDQMYDFTINGTVVGSYSKNSKLSTLLSDINNSDAGVRVSYSQITNNFLFTSKETGLESEIELGEGLAQEMFGVSTTQKTKDLLGLDETELKGAKFSINVDGKNVAFTFNSGNGTVKQMVDKVNQYLKSNKVDATASFDEDGSLVLTDSKGKRVEYTAANDDAIASKLAEPKEGYRYSKGQDAEFTITVNGEEQRMVRSSNSVNIDGLTITMKETFDTITAATDEKGDPILNDDGSTKMVYKADDAVTFKSSTDADKIVDAIKSMLEDYNAMMAEIKSAYSTMPYQKSDGTFANYEPLTEDDRAGMTESAIERYEEKAKQGILFGDRTLSGLYDKLRNVFSPAGEDGAFLRAMGISTSFSISDGSQAVTLDENKLRDMLESDPERVAEVFTKSDGVIQNMKSTLETYSKTTGEPKGILIQQAGSPLSSLSLMNNTWQSEIDSLNTQIEKWQDKLSNQVDRYTQQFTRLEMLIQQMNSQSSTLAGMMGG